MHFDDRLATVLQHRAAGERAARVQYRQLLDLLSDAEGGVDPVLTRAAYRRLDALGMLLSLGQRERLAGECSARIRNPRLLTWFAGAEPRVALAALSRAALDESQWLELIPELPIRARGLLRHRRNLPASALRMLDRLGVRDRVLPEPAVEQPNEVGQSPEAASDEQPAALDLGRFAQEEYLLDSSRDRTTRTSEPAAPTSDAGDLGALVRRIEAFQRARKERAQDTTSDAPRLPLGGEPAEDTGQSELKAFLFTTDEAGRVDWAEMSVAPLLVGTMLASGDPSGSSGFASAFAARRPLVSATHELAGAPAIAGSWILDAAPRFAPRTARFTGYVGRFRRPVAAPVDTRAALAADRVRQLLHELRTPVTAIQGFAEVIQQQTVGPVPHGYRALAAGIASDAARMLAGFAEIERLAMLEAGRQDLPEGVSDFVAVTRRQVAQLQTVLSPRVSRIEANFALSAAAVPLSSEVAELIAWRFLGTLASAIAAGETMSLSLTNGGRELRLIVRLPAALAQVSDVFAGEIQAPGTIPAVGLLGAGFALRLARAEARAAGGDLVREDAGTMILTLPMGEARAGNVSRPSRAVERGVSAPAAAPLAQSPRPR